MPLKRELDAMAWSCSSSSSQVGVVIPGWSRMRQLVQLDPNKDELLEAVLVETGQILMFVRDRTEGELRLSVKSKEGSGGQDKLQPQITCRRGYDLVAFDEVTRTAAFYVQGPARIALLSFDENYRSWTWDNVELVLSDYMGSTDLTCMLFIPGRKEILVISTDCNVRVFQANRGQSIGLKTGNSLVLPGPSWKAHISEDGAFLVVLFKSFSSDATVHMDTAATALLSLCQESCKPSRTNRDEKQQDAGYLVLEIYSLTDMSHLKTVVTDYVISDISNTDSCLVSFGSQSSLCHLILFDRLRPHRGVQSKVLEMSSTTTKACQVVQVEDRGQKVTTTVPCEQKPPSALGFIFEVFEKFSTSPPLGEEHCLKLNVVLGAKSADEASRQVYEDFVYHTMGKIQKEEGKDLSMLKVSASADTVGNYLLESGDGVRGSLEHCNIRRVGDWMRSLICLIPIQIARAEKNSLRPMMDGLQMPSNLSY